MSDLIWSVIGKHNAFKVGSRHETAIFSTEPGNRSGRHSPHASGFTHAVAVDVVATKKKNAYGTLIRVRTSNKGRDSKPAKQWKTYRTRGSDNAQRRKAEKLVLALGGDETVSRLTQLRVSKVLRASYRKKLARATFRAHKRHLAKEKRAKK